MGKDGQGGKGRVQQIQGHYPDEDFKCHTRNNAVFSAFKVHRMQNDMARLLLDSNGILKPFDKWVQEVLPIASPSGSSLAADGV